MLDSRTGQIAPNAITETDISLERPRNRIATGMTAEAGSGRRNSSVGSRKSRARADEPIAAPITMPRSDANTQPNSMRSDVASSDGQIEPSAKSDISTSNDREGAGKKTGEMTRNSARSCHTSSRPTAKASAGRLDDERKRFMPPSPPAAPAPRSAPSGAAH